jgi:hypothetical protein
MTCNEPYFYVLDIISCLSGFCRIYMEIWWIISGNATLELMHVNNIASGHSGYILVITPSWFEAPYDNTLGHEMLLFKGKKRVIS